MAACGDPLDRVGKLSELDLSENDPAREALVSSEDLAPAESGIFGGLFRSAEPNPVDSSPEVVASVGEQHPTDAAAESIVGRGSAKQRRNLLIRLRRAAAISAAAIIENS